jgi:type I restriction enzyme S subunit
MYDRTQVANLNQAVALIRLKPFVDKRYVLNVLNSPRLIDHMNEKKVDVARANISLKDVANFPIPLPSIAEQREIVRRVEALFKTADALEARYFKAKAHVDKLTQSILAKAFRGELVPRDPNDEPASVLLECLKTESNGSAAGKRRSRK